MCEKRSSLFWKCNVNVNPDQNAPFAPQAHDRIMGDIQALRSSESRQLFKNLRAISAAVVEKGGVVSTNPLGF